MTTLTTAMKRRAWPWLAGLLLAGAAGAQGTGYGSAVGLPAFRDFLRAEAMRGPSGSHAGWVASANGNASGLDTLFLAPAPREGLGAALAVEPPPVSRETLEGASEGLHPIHGVPGGIVFGLVSRAQGELEGELAGARIERGADGRLELSLASGRRLRCPEIAPEVLGACLAFTAAKREALVDITHGLGSRPRLAPAFAGGALEELLVRMDGLPHRVRPETRAYKSLIVDRAVGIEARWSEATADLVLTAELEVRLYAGGDSGWARRVGTLEMGAPEASAQGATASLAAELAPLAELAAWLGFLRRVQELDPAGVATLRASLGR